MGLNVNLKVAQAYWNHGGERLYHKIHRDQWILWIGLSPSVADGDKRFYIDEESVSSDITQAIVKADPERYVAKGGPGLLFSWSGADWLYWDAVEANWKSVGLPSGLAYPGKHATDRFVILSNESDKPILGLEKKGLDQDLLGTLNRYAAGGEVADASLARCILRLFEAWDEQGAEDLIDGNTLTIRKAQQTQPWTVPYSSGVLEAEEGPVPHILGSHAAFHATKSVGKLCAVFEALDHHDGRISEEQRQVVANMSADLVTVALRFANLFGFDLSDKLHERALEKNGKGYYTNPKNEGEK